MEQKHFMDIEHIREEDTELRSRNTNAFTTDCVIQITEKFDGSNFCVAWDEEAEELKCFSRKKELNFQNTLNGFWNYVQAFPENVVNEFKKHPNWRVFGEANCKNKIKYNDTGKVQHWYVYDIYDVNAKRYLLQGVVKQFCEDTGLEYIHELYYGPFVSWDHCRSFMNSPAYGECQEGIVCKIQGEWDESDRNPHVLKIVNEDFRESTKTKEKVIDPEKEEAKAAARETMESIVTERRVEKLLFKLRDEGVLPNKIEPKDFKIVAQNLPKAVWDDIMKEEKELVMQCGEYGGKLCQQIAMSIARDLVLGK